MAAWYSNSSELSTTDAPHCLAADPRAKTLSSVKSPTSSIRPTLGISSIWRAASVTRLAARPDSFAPATSASRAEPALSASNRPAARRVKASARAFTRPAAATTRHNPSSSNPSNDTARNAATASAKQLHTDGSNPADAPSPSPAGPLPLLSPL